MSQLPIPSHESPDFDLSNEWAGQVSSTTSSTELRMAKERMSSLGLTAMLPFFETLPQQASLLADQIWNLCQGKEKKSPETPSKLVPIPYKAQTDFNLSNEWASQPVMPTTSEVEVAKQRMASLGLTAMEPFFGASLQQSTLLAQQIWALHQAKKTSPATPSKVPRRVPSFQPSGMPVAEGSGSGPPSAAPALQTLPTTSPLRLPVSSLRVPGSKLRGMRSYAALQHP
ncbi:hypothetical protein IE81DRAFT_349661 [Ceraceosorus guamensis]|uniref:Uncharacterized protein n=1 Tax=Ceraceosorus guamensis TaxID=1522189 RepID=A0A316VR72_9BASI|nr:hypothetical protein IE81DRAFT_349661 [Ceraceosorus guamensis]PWN40012.1 hypothetical protein IE81DRAFT_349661 [Ceraceosorus guamensis]